MPRPYRKPHKRKREQDYDRETDLPGKEDASLDMRDEVTQNGLGNPAEDNDDMDYLPGIPMAPLDEKNKPSVIFILEKASLEVCKVGKALLTILDMPLNKAETVRAVYVRTEKCVLIEVKPYVRIPRTMKRFAGIMLQLLQKMSISAVGKREKLMRVIKNPVTQYLPPNSRKIGFSYSSENWLTCKAMSQLSRMITTLFSWLVLWLIGKLRSSWRTT